MSAVAEALRRIAVELREHPERWTQGCNARDKYGMDALIRDPDATAWCAVGLTHKHLTEEELDVAWDVLCRAMRTDNIPSFNDEEGRTAAEVADAFDKAAALAEQSP